MSTEINSFPLNGKQINSFPINGKQINEYNSATPAPQDLFLFSKEGVVKQAPINDILPSQASNAGKVLTTNGTVAAWQTPNTGGDILFSSSDYVNTPCQVDTIGTAITLISETINFAVSNTITLDFDLGIFNNSTANRNYTFIISLGSFSYNHVVTVGSTGNAAAVRFQHKITSDATWTLGVGTCIQVPSGAAYGVTSGASALAVKAIGSPDYGTKTLSVKCYSSATTATQAIELISYQIRKSEDI